jgi:hypothetical protein
MTMRKEILYRFSSDLVLLLACSLFFASVIEPFMVFSYVPPRPSGMSQPYSTSYWSFRDYSQPSEGQGVAKLFNDYWFGTLYWTWDLFIFIFALQSATVLFGVLSFFPKERKLAVVSSILSVMPAFPMILAYDLFSRPWPSFLNSFGPGYWFIYPSAFMFLLSPALKYAAMNESEKRSILEGMKLYWKHHVPDIVFIGAGFLLILYTASQVALALSDWIFHDYLLHGELPRGATVVPYHNPWNVFHTDLIIVPPQSMSAWDWLGLFSPLVIPSAIIVLECARYYLWRRRGVQKWKT